MSGNNDDNNQAPVQPPVQPQPGRQRANAGGANRLPGLAQGGGNPQAQPLVQPPVMPPLPQPPQQQQPPQQPGWQAANGTVPNVAPRVALGARNQPQAQGPVQQPQPQGWNPGGLGRQAAAPRMAMNQRQPVPQPAANPVVPIPVPNNLAGPSAAWREDVLRFLGWNGKAVEQGALNTKLGTMMQGQQFNSSPAMADLRQKQTDLSAAYAVNGMWDAAQEMQAAQVQATVAFENMAGGKAELQGGSANPTFWVRGQADPITGENREAIFKPATVEPTARWMPSGGEPAREALAGRVADLLTAYTNLNYKMPVTDVISVDKARISDYNGNNVATTPTVVGSLQQFAPNAGALRQNFMQQKDNVPAQDCQNVAIMDTIMLNVDRHPGNLLLDAAGGVLPIDHGLSFPPSSAIVENGILEDLAGEKNVLTSLPNAFQPFSPQSLAGIASIRPNVMVDALRAENATIEAVHPETKGSISDDSLAVTKRSVEFLKLAAPSLPPAVVQIALGANGRALFDPNLSDQNFTQLATTIIAEYGPKVDGLREFYGLTQAEQDQMTDVMNNGVQPPRSAQWINSNADLVMAYVRAGGPPDVPAQVPKLQPPPKPQVPEIDARATVREIKQVLPDIQLDPAKQQTWMNQWQKIREQGGVAEAQAAVQVAAQPPTKLSEVQKLVSDRVSAAQRQRDLAPIYTAFPTMRMSDGDIRDVLKNWGMFLNLGGRAALAHAQQRHPTLPVPTDPAAAVLLMRLPSAAPNGPEPAVVLRLDYLDSLVALDGALVSAQNQALIAQARADLNAGQLQNPAAAVEALVKLVTTDGILRLKARFDAISGTAPPNIVQGWPIGVFTDLYAGKFKVPVQELQRYGG